MSPRLPERESAEAAPPTFDKLPLSEDVRKALRDMGYEHPTPVQLALFAPAIAGKDLVVQARTGTGKTTAFGLPLIDRLVKRPKGAVQALILCPTRELALQVSRELEQLAKYRQVAICAVYGGAPMPRQVEAIQRGAAIIVGTPGRVLDHLKRRTLDPREVRALVLDESDEMLSMGFERELTAILERLPPERQTILLSATLPPDIERMARTRLKSPEFVTLSGDHIGALEVSHFVYLVTGDKLGALTQVLELENPESAVIFCNTRDQTQVVAQALQRKGFGADWLNGDLPQADREKVMRATREGKLRYLVATDVAARGIDISHLTHVINCDFPQDAEGYVHRTGRTGRAGRTGTAISLVTPQDIGALYILRLTYKIRPLERQLPSAGDARTRFEADVISALAEAFAPSGRDPQDRAMARRLLSHDDADVIVAGMLREHMRANPGFTGDAEARRRGQLPEPVATEAVTTRPAAAAAPITARPGRDTDSPTTERTAAPPAKAEAPDTVREEPTEPPPAPMPEPSAEGDDDGPGDAPGASGGVELHLDLGRRDGVRPRHIKTALEQGGLAPEVLLRVRVRERYSFLEVPPEAAQAALAALNGATIGDRTAKATLSQRVKPS